MKLSIIIEKIENIVVKGEIAHFEHFLDLHKFMFSKEYFSQITDFLTK